MRGSKKRLRLMINERRRGPICLFVLFALVTVLDEIGHFSGYGGNVVLFFTSFTLWRLLLVAMLGMILYEVRAGRQHLPLTTADRTEADRLDRQERRVMMWATVAIAVVGILSFLLKD